MLRSLQASRLKSTALFALVLTAGLQLLRVFFPSVAWYLKDTIGVESTTLALYALVVMNVGFLAAILNKFLGRIGMLWLTAGGIALARFIEQLIISPVGDLWISMLGCGLLALFLPIFISHIRVNGQQLAGPSWTFGLTLGLSIDSAIRGFTTTLDLSWISGPLPMIVVALLSGTIILLLIKTDFPTIVAYTESRWQENLAFLALGPYLIIQLIALQNQGWISEISGLSSSWAFLLLMLGNLLAIAGVSWGLLHQHTFRPALTITTAVLITASSFNIDRPGLFFIFTILLVQLLYGWCWATMGILSMQTSRKGLASTTIFSTFGLILFIALAFIYYASLDIDLPFSRHAILPTAGILFAIIFLGVTSQKRKLMTLSHLPNLPLIVNGGLVVLAMFLLVLRPSSTTVLDPEGKPVKIMTYNIHSAYNVEGRQDLEAIARVIEDSDADIVALQEISRGWLVDGSTDLVSWFSQRLDMQALFQGTTGPMWGNAILSRYPILSYTSGGLPTLDSILERGYLWAHIDIGENQSLNIIATHLHHIAEDDHVRLVQVEELIRVWDGSNQTILLGDLNALPEAEELKPILDAGFIDAWVQAGHGQGFTYSSDNPYKRIDWIWHTADLLAEDMMVLQTTASDHLPVVVTIKIKP